KNTPWPSDLVVFGEVGLAGEIRPVPNGEERLKEAFKHGFKRAIIPRDNLIKKGGLDMQMLGARRLKDAIDEL
ncbi:MAG TPA: DNA repair protein RadA, partial [Gammaproteobacteria bacterium]|nr:DNA repair protein RadA [Gammaproteobacteria bacterium]